MPAISTTLYEAAVAFAAEKYDPLLETLRLKDVVNEVRKSSTIWFVRRRSLEVDVFVTKVEGKNLTFWMTLGLHCLTGTDIETFLRLLVEKYLPGSGISVQGDALVGEVTLPEEPYRVPTPRNGAMYFLNREKEVALSYLAQYFVHPR